MIISFIFFFVHAYKLNLKFIQNKSSRTNYMKKNAFNQID